MDYVHINLMLGPDPKDETIIYTVSFISKLAKTICPIT